MRYFMNLTLRQINEKLIKYAMRKDVSQRRIRVTAQGFVSLPVSWECLANRTRV